MKTSKGLSQAIPPHDYRPALQGALSWLGKRYLLAEPVNKRGDERVHEKQCDGDDCAANQPWSPALQQRY